MIPKYSFILSAFVVLGIVFALVLDCSVQRNLDLTEYIPPPTDSNSIDTSPPVVFRYHVYYGSLHNHTALMGGTGTQQQAYAYAKETAKLDFFGLAEHDYGLDSISWNIEKDVANKNNQDGSFVAFWGFEWSSGSYGHVAVIHSSDFCYSSDASAPSGSFAGFCKWLNTQNCAAFLNHPGYVNGYNIEFEHFSGARSDKIVGMELWNKSVPFSTFFYNDGYYTNDNNAGFFDEALNRGWKIGAAGSHDNHEATWGTANDYRLAILADTLTRDSLYAALLARRFYSTLDKNLKLSFAIGGHEMGSTVLAGNDTCTIFATDGDNEIFSEVMVFDKNHTIAHRWKPNKDSVAIVWNSNLRNGDYYYVKVTQNDGDEAISSPIWISDLPMAAPLQ